MKNTKTIFKLLTLFEYEEEEAFLQEEHKNGWKVVDYTLPGFYKFEKCQPENMVYRIDFTNENGSKNPQYRQMFEDNCWEFLWSVNGFSIFRKALSENTTDNSNEIFSDNASKLQMLQNKIPPEEVNKNFMSLKAFQAEADDVSCIWRRGESRQI